MVFDYSKDCLLHFSKGLQLRWQSIRGASVETAADKRRYPHRPHMAPQNLERSIDTHQLRVTECARFVFAIINPNNRCQLLRDGCLATTHINDLQHSDKTSIASVAVQSALLLLMRRPAGPWW